MDDDEDYGDEEDEYDGEYDEEEEGEGDAADDEYGDEEEYDQEAPEDQEEIQIFIGRNPEMMDRISQQEVGYG